MQIKGETMKKVLKVFGIVILAVLGGIALLFLKAALTPSAPRNYTKTVKTGGEIESRYLQNGSCEVGYFEQKTDGDFKKFEVWYPKEMTDNDKAYPVIVVLNGTGVKASKYKAQFRHFASWGFIVIGTEEEEAWDGVAAEASLVFLLNSNEDPDSLFYGKIDVERIGAVGHSQGGAGVLNTATEHEHSDLYKTIVPLSPTGEETAAGLGWFYDPEKIGIPTLLLAGTEGDFEMKYVIPTEAMHDLFDKLGGFRIMARKTECEHGEMLYSADGYVTAWFMWQLQGDEEAAKAFIGEEPELFRNELYQEQRRGEEKTAE